MTALSAYSTLNCWAKKHSLHFVSFLFLLIAEIASNFSLELKGWSWWNEHFLGCNSISHSNGSKTDPLKAKVSPHYSLWPLNTLISDRSWTGQSQRPTLMNEGSLWKRDELWAETGLRRRWKILTLCTAVCRTAATVNMRSPLKGLPRP